MPTLQLESLKMVEPSHHENLSQATGAQLNWIFKGYFSEQFLPLDENLNMCILIISGRLWGFNWYPYFRFL